jgi:predicted membrane protein
MNGVTKTNGSLAAQVSCLTIAICIMVVGTAYPPIMMNAAGRVDHRLALAIFWAMSAGFVRGVGFIPTLRIWRGLFSGWACLTALILALLVKSIS